MSLSDPHVYGACCLLLLRYLMWHFRIEIASAYLFQWKICWTSVHFKTINHEYCR